MFLKVVFWLAVVIGVLFVGRLFSGARKRAIGKTEQAARDAVRRSAERKGHGTPAEDLVHCTTCDKHVTKDVGRMCEREKCPLSE